MIDSDEFAEPDPEPPPRFWWGTVLSFEQISTYLRNVTRAVKNWVVGAPPPPPRIRLVRDRRTRRVYIKRYAALICLTLGLVRPVLAATTVDIPGNGIDEDSTGGDQACAAPDADCDGYTSDGSLGTAGTTYTDCNDGDSKQYPGTQIVTGCSSYDYKTCQTNGSYTTCQTGPLDEHTGSGHAYYINAGTGSDSNNGLSPGAAWASLNNVSYYSSGAPGTAISPVAGDVYYIMGSTDISGTHTGCYGGTYRCGFSTYNRNGTSSDHFKLKQYPGATARLAPGNSSGTEGSAIEIYYSDYWDIDGIEITGGYGSGISGGEGADHITISRTYVHDKDGQANNNLAGIMANGGSYYTFSHNRVKDVCDSTASSTTQWYNTRGIGLFETASFRVDHNQVWYTLGVSDSGACKGRNIGMKHSLLTGDAGTSRIDHNRAWNGYDLITICSPNVEVDHNLLVSDNEDNYCYREISGNGGTNTYHYLKNLDVHHNTMIGCLMEQDYESGARSSTYVSGNDYDHNIIKSGRASYSGGSSLIGMCPSCSGGEYTAISGANTFHDNAYYASATTAGFYANGNVNFAGWNSAGYDGTGTVVTDPTFNAYLQATAVNTTDKGWSLAGTSSSTSSSTTTTTATTTSVIATNMGGLAPRYQ